MPTTPESEMHFGEYIETLRTERGRSLRKTAIAIGISPQYYSEIEKGRRSALTAERLDALKIFLDLSDEESRIMYNKAAEARKYKDVTVPQDFSDYIVERDYAMAALRVAKKLNADEDDWQRFVDDLIRRKGGAT
jgi:transcriptional regulator with XRE-family HTH domain